MATQKKRPAASSAGKRAAGKKKTSGAAKKSTKRPVRREVGGGICLLAALCVVISYFQSQGLLIQFLPDFLKGLTGYGYYLWAVSLFVAAWVLLAHHGRPVALRTACDLLAPVVMGALGHVLTSREELVLDGKLAGRLWTSGMELSSGGVISGLIGHGVQTVFGTIVSVVIFALLLLGLLAVVFHQQIGALWEAWQDREPLEYEEEAYPAPREKQQARERKKEAPPQETKRASIDIPLDDAPAEKRPGILSGFFRQKSQDQRTPDQVLSGMEIEVPERPDRVEEQINEAAPLSREENGAAAGLLRHPEDMAEPAVVQEPRKRRSTAESRAEVASAAAEVGAEIDSRTEEQGSEYSYPPITLLDQGGFDNHMEAGAELRTNAQRLADTLTSFGVDATAGDVIRGPSITRYEFVLDQGVKLSKVTNLADDIALALGTSGVRIAPVPDKISVVGIEVPNKQVSPVLIRDVLESRAFVQHKSPVAFTVGRDIGNNDVIGDIAKLPHMLIAGTTGSGKSVCTNALIVSLLYKSTPEEVRFIMVDPKMVELGIYNGIPHLLIPVVTDPKKAAGALQWAVFEMMKRYKTFSELGVKKLEEYNALAEQREDLKKMPTVVVVIDELADLMLVAAKEVEESICRVAQMGRASGIHLIIATQRPSADVITGLMKANIPSRIAFAVASSLESRIILDTPGAEKLVGRGDMLYAPLGSGKPQRVQGCLISGEEIERVVEFVKKSGEAQYSDEVIQKIEEAMAEKEKGGKKDRYDGSTTAEVEAMEGDELFPAAVEVVLETGQASVSMLQRRLKLGYSRAARLVDQMEERGIVGPFEGSKPRQLLITKAQWQELQMKQSGGGAPAEPEASAADLPWDEEET